VVLSSSSKCSFGSISTNRVAEPTLAQDAATKKNYVDTALNSSNDLAIAMYLWGILVVKEAVPLSGAVTTDNTGLVAIADDAVTTQRF
jgi:1-deoxy-D-xylulose 5-phosphate reductoisomerase